MKERRTRGFGRRRLYTGGALMVLAPIGVSGCASDKGAIAIVPADVVVDADCLEGQHCADIGVAKVCAH